jgi:phosphoribosylformylglycinamidine (FGAM) synthase-like enzyme
MAIGGRLGGRIDLGAVPFDAAGLASTDATARDLAIAFGESPGRFVCAVRPADADRFAACLAGVPWAWIGAVTADAALEIVGTSGRAERLPVARLDAAWRGTGGPHGAAS